MVFPRVAAAIFVLLLIGTLSLLCVSPVTLVGPGLAYGSNLEHADGKIVSIETGPDRGFILETATGHLLHFQCGGECLMAFGHMLRHLHEHAHTDVYYRQAAGNSLLALDVD